MKFLKRNWMVFLVMGALLMSLVTMASAKAPDVAASPQAVEVAHQSDEAPVTPPIDLAKDLVAAGPVILIVNGIVAWLKKAKVKGTWLTISSLLVGLLLGIAYKYAVSPLTTFSNWFWAIVFGVILGLIACGVYDAYRNKINTTSTTEVPQ